ncbi:MAG: hypothetical protein ACOX5Q_01435 [Bacillota bacterium]|jgi:hypothetical protein|nr:hypothetical protein [Candidatus Fermentithermobacillaceae bacterium]
MECSVVQTTIEQEDAVETALKTAQMKGRRPAESGGIQARCRLMYSPFWSAKFRCEVKRVLLPPKRGVIAAGADAFSGFVSLIAGSVSTVNSDIQGDLLLPVRFDWPQVRERAQKHVKDFFVYKLRRVPTYMDEQVDFLYRPIWVCVLDDEGKEVIRCVDAHSRDPLYYLDSVADEIARLAGLLK